MTELTFEDEEFEEEQPGRVYYDLNETLSRGAGLSFVYGPRDVGKTYAGKNWWLKDFISNGAEGVYVRRLQEELDETKHSLFDDVAHVYGKEVKARGSLFHIRNLRPLELEGKEVREWEQANPWVRFGYSMALSQQQMYKSGVYDKVTKMIYDEIIIENPNKRYLQNEPSQFVNLMTTVFRHRPKRKIVAMSNAGAMWNPYFSYYKVTSKDLQQTFIRRNGGKVLFHIYRNEAAIASLRDSVMGDFGDEEYIRYAVEGKFRDVNEFMIVEKQDVKIVNSLYNVVAESGKMFSIHMTMDGCFLAIKGGLKSKRTYALHSGDMVNLYSPELITDLRERYFRKSIFFDSIDTRMEILNTIKPSS